MTRDEHRREAERLLTKVAKTIDDTGYTDEMHVMATAVDVARAQVHATLAASTRNIPGGG